MKIRQLQLPLDDELPTLSSIHFGSCFKLANGTEIYVKMNPVKSLLHSTLIYEVITRGDFFVLNVSSGDFTVMPKSVRVHPICAELTLI